MECTRFRPGLVGGHCIGVDPYYLIYKASISDSSSEMVSLARKINNSMSGFIVDAIVQKLIQEKHSIKMTIYMFWVLLSRKTVPISGIPAYWTLL